MKRIPTSKTARLILASTSPRRRELLAGLELPFEVLAPAVDETAWPKECPASFALRMAHEKAAAVAVRLDGGVDTVIIAADTIVVLGETILGKPADAAMASDMLRALSGARHTVITGLCVRVESPRGYAEWGDAVRTDVVFRALSEAEIHHYVAGGEPMDKAGAYAIQGGAAGMVDHIDGSYSNVVGLPMEALARILRLAGVMGSGNRQLDTGC